jgi:hypothetical protein
MASNIDIYLDAQGSGILVGGSAAGGVLPQFTRNDVYTFRLRIQDAPAAQVPVDIDTTGTTLKLGIGNIDDVPTDGQFKLTCNGTTSSAITFSSTPLQIYNAISNNVSTVATFGNEEYSYVLTATQPNTAMSFGGDSFTLFPLSSIFVSTRRFPASGIQAQQIIRLRRNPAVFSNSFVSSSTAGVATLEKLQDGSSTSNETYRLTLGSDVAGGSFVLNYGGNSTTAIAIGATAVCAAEALSAVTGIGAGNISIVPLTGESGYSISFVRDLGSQNVSTSLVLDPSGIYFAPWREATVTFATAELDELFAEAGTDTITPTIEIEMTDAGNPKTLYQGGVTIRKDLITNGSSIPANQESYYTAAEVDSLFVEDSATNVDATNTRLVAGGQISVNYGSRTLNNSSGTQVVSYRTGLAFANTPMGFYGTTVTAQPENINVVSGLINLGLIANGATYGVLPSSPRTLTTTASIYFGVVGGNDTNSVSVTVTGCQINDIVLIGLPPINPDGLSFLGHVTTANGLEIDCVNATNGSQTPATATYRITVIGY